MKLYTAGSTIENRKACQELGVGLMMCDGCLRHHVEKYRDFVAHHKPLEGYR